MDPEMALFREAVRSHLHALGATPVMWEEITPRDEGPQRAYLSGVDRSSAFVLILGSRYGITDHTGYSPTHHEGNRAAERRIPRLLFTLSTIKDSDRDGRLNDWLRSLYNDISGASFATATDLVSQLDARFREMAAQSERLWIKLGSLVFPGTVSSSFDNRGDGEISVAANVTDGAVRRTLLAGGQSYRSRAERVTWSNSSFPIQVEFVSLKTEYSGEEQVQIICKTSQNWNVGSSSIHTVMASFGKFTAAEMAEIWARRSILGEPYKEEDRTTGLDISASFSKPETVTLPEILRTYSAGGWLAEGLTRLYAVEEVARRYEGHFLHLDVGPATATNVRIQGTFTFGAAMGARNESINIEGSVRLS
jgi:hypothetical protein